MSDTKQILSFMQETRNSLGALADRLASIRYDLVGSRKDLTPEEPKNPGSSVPTVSEMCLTDGVEYFAGDIHAAINKLDNEIDYLASRVNHKEGSPVSVAAAKKEYF